MNEKVLIIYGSNVSKENIKLLKEVKKYLKSMENPNKKQEICEEIDKTKCARDSERRKIYKLRGINFKISPSTKKN